MDTTFKSVLENLIASSLNGNSGASRQFTEKLFEDYSDRDTPDFDTEYERCQIDRTIFSLKINSTRKNHSPMTI